MMNNYKKIYFLSGILLFFFSTFILSGCTKEFEERNIDKTKLTSLNPSDVKGLFTSAQYATMNVGPGVDYQQAQNLYADLYAQYFAITQTAFATDRFSIVQQWLKYQWISTYVSTMPAISTIIKETNTPETKALNAIARIWKVFVIHRSTDYYGPIPYSKIGISDDSVPYDSQKDIYYDLLKELAEASADLKSNMAQPSYGSQDVIYGGNNAKWLKFANTLRLRLALRISKVEPAKAKQEAEAAVNDGVMLDVADDGYLKTTTDRPNGLGRITQWNEFRMSTTMESILIGYGDPRLSTYFQPAVNDNKYRGIRNGMTPAEQTLPENDYRNASNVAERFTPPNMGKEPMSVIRSGEAYLLRAEGAVNGWNMGGTAQDLYAKGIEMSMRTNGITDVGIINAYINSTNLPSAPGGYFNTPALTDIPVKFSADPVKQREQIGTQKWLALFPDGHEAWAEVRRSGYPKRYFVVHSDNPDIPETKFIRRIPFLEYDKSRNGPAVTEAVKLLGGPDNGATPLWWDKN
ncbi:MAG: SusD/RagB family nutrient-binding outer membrane lipoprotein [Pedobacter sp.]|jgi:hypothetical protein